MKRLNKLKKYSNSLQILRRGKRNTCKKILNNGGKGLMRCLCEISYNILKGNVPLTITQKKKLSPYKNILRKLGRKNKLSLTKKKNLAQKGGFLNALLAPVLTLLGGILGR